MTRALKERVDSREARREPPYRSTMELTPEQQKTLGEKLGGIQNYNPVVLREMARKERARAAQQEFETNIAMVRQMARSYMASAQQEQTTNGNGS